MPCLPNGTDSYDPLRFRINIGQIRVILERSLPAADTALVIIPIYLRCDQRELNLYNYRYAEQHFRERLPLVASFVEHCPLRGKKPATMRRYLSTTSRAHKVASFADPYTDEFVQLEIKGLHHVMLARQRRAKGLNWEHIKRFIENAGVGRIARNTIIPRIHSICTPARCADTVGQVIRASPL